jgi:hypothetical protein
MAGLKVGKRKRGVGRGFSVAYGNSCTLPVGDRPLPAFLMKKSKILLACSREDYILRRFVV